MGYLPARPHASRSLRNWWRLGAGLVSAVAVAALGAAWADGPAFHARVDRPVLYQGQWHAGGRIELVGVGGGELLSLQLDDHRVALVFRHKLGGHHPGDVPVFYFRSAQDGLELVDIAWSGDSPRGLVEVLMMVRARPGRAPA